MGPADDQPRERTPPAGGGAGAMIGARGARLLGAALRASLPLTFSPRHLANRWRLLASCGRDDAFAAFPHLIHVELTNVCNLSFPMCPSAAMRRPRGFMDEALFDRLIDELAASPIEMVFLQCFGESLLHPRFVEYLKRARAAGLRVGMSTNATRLDERIGQAIVEQGMDLLVLSYDADDPVAYGQRRPGGDHARVRAQIERFLAYKGRRLPLTVVQYLQGPNDRPDPQREARWRRLPALVKHRPMHNWLGDQAAIDALAGRGAAATTVCDQPWRHPVVFWDGRVVPCCNLYDAQVTFGDLHEASLAQIWAGEAARAFRRLYFRPRVLLAPDPWRTLAATLAERLASAWRGPPGELA